MRRAVLVLVDVLYEPDDQLQQLSILPGAILQSVDRLLHERAVRLAVVVRHLARRVDGRVAAAVTRDGAEGRRRAG